MQAAACERRRNLYLSYYESSASPSPSRHDHHRHFTTRCGFRQIPENRIVISYVSRYLSWSVLTCPRSKVRADINQKTSSLSGTNSSVEILSINIIRQGFSAKGFDAAKTWEKELPLLEEKRLKKIEEAKKEAERQKKIAEEKMEAAAASILPVLEDYKSKAKPTDSGLLSYTIVEGNGQKPALGSVVSLSSFAKVKFK